jgi:hypothetical protein
MRRTFPENCKKEYREREREIFHGGEGKQASDEV